MAENDRAFLAETIAWLDEAGIVAYVAGGWAEELRGIREAGPHQDIDLVCRTRDLPRLERLLARGGVTEIAAKRLSHKRAMERCGVLVEIFLASSEGCRRVTDFFDGRYVHRWPGDLLAEDLVDGLRVVGPDALASYREKHHHVDAARSRAGP